MTKLDFICYLRQNGYEDLGYGGTFNVLGNIKGGVIVLADEEGIHLRKKDSETQIMVYEYLKYDVKVNDLGCMELLKRGEKKEEKKKKGSGLGALAALAGALGGVDTDTMPPIMDGESEPTEEVVENESEGNDGEAEEG